jgi:hypothetical protein
MMTRAAGVLLPTLHVSLLTARKQQPGGQLTAIEVQPLSSPYRLDGELLAGCAQRLRDCGAFVMKNEGARMKAQLHPPLRTSHSTITSHGSPTWQGRHR